MDFSAISMSKSCINCCFESGVGYFFFKCFRSSTLWTPRIFFSLIRSLCFCWSFLVIRQRCTPGIWQPCLRTLIIRQLLQDIQCDQCLHSCGPAFCQCHFIECVHHQPNGFLLVGIFSLVLVQSFECFLGLMQMGQQVFISSNREQLPWLDLFVLAWCCRWQERRWKKIRQSKPPAERWWPWIGKRGRANVTF